MRSATSSASEFSSAKQLLLERRLQGAIGSASKQPTIRRYPRGESAPLSFAQQRLWFLDQLIGGSGVYNISEVLRLKGPLDVAALEWSLAEIVRRHESLRTTFSSSDGEPLQIISGSAALKLEVTDLEHLPASRREEEMHRLAVADSQKPFDLTRDVLIRASLFRLSEKEHVLAITMHHIGSDAWSLGILYQELTELYGGRVSGQPATLPELPIQYADYAIWQREWVQGKLLEEQLGYWKEQLAGAPDLLQLPTDKPRPAVQSFRGGNVYLTLPAKLAKSLKLLNRQEGATSFMTLLTAFNILLSRYSRQTDILIGSPIAGRTQIETEGLIGFFVNTLVLRNNLSGNPTFRELLQRVRKVTLDAYAHQDLPLEKLVIELKPERTSSHSPLFQVMFVLQNAPAFCLNLPGLFVSPIAVDNETSKFDLILSITDTGEELIAGFEYNRDIFEAETVVRMLEHFRVLLEGIVNQPATRLSDLPIVTEEERQKLLVDWNNTRTNYPADQSIHQLFEEQVAKTPAAPAVSFGDCALSYAELNERANQLAHALKRAGVGSGSLVALSMERSVEMIVSLVAILKAGGAYVSLDPSYPKDRLLLMLEDVQPAVILTQTKWRSGLPVSSAGAGPRLICVDEEMSRLSGESTANLVNESSPQSLAYVSFTSGSTGRPKGVCVPHRAVVRLVRDTNYVSINEADVFLQLAPIAFDASTFEIWGCLLNGARLVVYPPEVPALRELADTIQRERITTLWLTSGLFQQMIEEHLDHLKHLRQLLAGGDVLSVAHVKKALEGLPNCRLINGYGPTENTTFTCCHIITSASLRHRSIPIGKPIANTQVYVLDEHGGLVPPGVPGELYVGGDGLALGYLKRMELTAEKFVPNRFSDEPGARLYRTGDLVRWLPEGELEFLGRFDTQVKIRGFRVEPGEIETVLGSHPKVRDCIVTVHSSSTAGKRLVAYFVPESDQHLSSDELRPFLQQKLPEYMVPSFFVPLPELPLNGNGKVHRAALPIPEMTAGDAETTAKPRDEVEAQLAQLWERVLGVKPIGIRSNFFELGGHSMLAVQLVAQIERTFGKKLSVASLFQAPTVEQLARVLRGHERNGGISSIVEIQPKGSRPPLFLVHGVGGGMFWGYTNLSRHLGPDQPIYGLKSRAMDGAPEFATIEEMATHYLADVRKVQPHGPYYLGGYCFGGNVAYEMAQQLKADGEEVAFVGLINCGPPNSGYGKIRWTPSFALKFLKNLGYWGKHSLQWTPAQRREFIHWKLRSLKKRAERLLGRKRHSANLDVDMLVDLSPYPEDQRRLWEAHINALIQYHPKSYPGRVTLFRSPGHQLLCSFDEQYGWGELAHGGVAVKIISGAHEQILEEPHVQRVAREMNNCLEQSRLELERLHKQGETPASAATSFPAAEFNKIVREWNETAAEFPSDQSYASLFEEQVKRTPNAVAIRFTGQELSYSELNSRANQLAHCLSRRGIGPESLVAIHANRSIEFAVAVLAVLKAGAAYLPIDPAYPKERLAWMLGDARAELVLTFSSLSAQLPAAARNVLVLDDPSFTSELRANNPETGPKFRHSPSNLAYVIYTSGSTGAPKGVEISYLALLNHNCAIKADYGLRTGDRVLQFTPLSFDISVEEILPSWLAGATVVFRNQEVLGSISKFLAFLERERITVANLPTAFFRALTESLIADVPADLRLVIIGGEKVSAEHWAMWHARVRDSVELINAYGLTETTVTSTLFKSDRTAKRDSIPIGRPIANTAAYVLDENLQPVPIGVAGELFIGGSGLARGYRNAVDLTAQRFVRNPFATGTASVIYKTGDRARFLPDGNLEFLGRLDDQIKLRGFRIQLGEIEAALGRHPAISHVVVHAKAYGDQEERLVAYFVPLNGASISTGELIAFLQQSLPEYMIPSAFVKLDGFPLTPNGKVDHQALPLPGTNRPALFEPLVAPRTELEQKIAAVWRSVLHLDEVGIHDNFFDLGAHSLHAMQVMSRLRDLLNLELPVSNLFEAPTIARLAAAISASAAQTPSAVSGPVRRAEGEGHPPLSFAQQRLWFLHQLQPTVPLYNLPQAVRLSGPLSHPALERTFSEIIRRHDVLRTTYKLQAGQPVQIVAPSAAVPIAVSDLSTLSPEAKERTLRDTVLAEARKPFDLERDLMLRVSLIKLDEQEHVLLLTTHHIAADGWSIEVLWKEIAGLYGNFVRGTASPLPELPIQYADFALWQRDWLQGQVLESQLTYWRKQLEGAPALLELPLDYPRPATQSCRGARQSLRLAAGLTDSLKSLAQAEGCTLFMALLAGFQSLLARYSNSEDVVVGTVIANRNRPELENLIGFFANTLVLRTDFSGEPTFREVLARTRKTTLDAYAHQDLPFERLVEELQPARDRSYHPVFQVMLVLQNVPIPSQPLPGLALSPSDTDSGVSKFDLLLNFVETGDGLSGFLEYSTELFEPATIQRIVGHLQTLLEDAVNRPDCKVGYLQLIPAAERQQLVTDWNSARVEIPAFQSIHQMFEAQAAKTPNAIAVVYGNEEITYAELNARANGLAHHLLSLGTRKEDLVGICANRTVDMIAAMLGSLKTGAAYVPIDPGYPRDRLNFILQDANARIVLTEAALSSLLDSSKAKVVLLDENRSEIQTQSRENPQISVASDNLAYVIFTSGSTGRPKGVAVEHQSVLSLAAWAASVFSRDDLDGVLAATSVCFDLSVFEIFVPLALGGRIVLAENVLALSQISARNTVRLINTVPSAMTELLRSNGVPESVRTVNLAGEPLAQSLVESIYQLPHVQRVFDLYGPTEATVYSTFALRSRGGRNHIGRPLPNEQLFIVDQRLQPVPRGVPGELLIGGAGLARGYLNQAELTAERFIENPFGQQGSRLYRTGDLVRYLADGNIEYLGRIDHQVKIRGFRIELGEVEAQLRKHPSIKEVVAVADQDASGNKRLVAYVVPTEKPVPSATDLRDYLRQSLPEYMVPSLFVQLEALPLTPNGKVNRKALPKPEAQTPSGGEISGGPQTDAELLLAQIWCEVLGLARVGVHDNFFDLGGHSLMITRILSRLRESLQIELPMKSIFEAPTIAEFALLVENAVAEQINSLTDDEVQKLDQTMTTSVRV